MKRGKLEIKRIEAKSSRQVTFSKRKGSLLKKARELSVLCDVDVGIIIFSGGGKLFEFASSDSLTQVVDRYLEHKKAEKVRNTNIELQDVVEKPLDNGQNEILQLITRYQDEKSIDQLDIQQLSQLENKLTYTLRHAAFRKINAFTNERRISTNAGVDLEIQQRM